MKELIEGGIKIFSAGFNAFLAVTLIAAAILFSVWCLIWVVLASWISG